MGSKKNMPDTEKITVHIDSDIKELIPRFLDGRRKDIGVIQDLLKHEDFKSIQTLGHSLKGNGAGYGFDRLSEIGGAIELAAETNNLDQIEKSLHQMTDFLDRVNIIYDE